MESAEARPLLAAAEAAASIDDYATAERLLREAAAVQERSIGAAHPDLANTFNNLGVVCERAGKLDDAEACYRRAYAIATTAFPADHPFVATSRQNLEEFCVANGRSIDAESPGGAAAAEGVTAGPLEQVDAGPEEQVDFVSEDAGSAEQSDAESEDAESVEPVAAGPIEQGPAYTASAPPPESVDHSRASAAPMRLQLDTPVPVKVSAVEEGPATPPGKPAHTAERAAVAQRVPERPSRALPLGALAVLVVSFAIVLVGLIAWPTGTSDDTSTDAGSSTPAPAETTPAATSPADTTAPAPPTNPSPTHVPSAPPAVTPDRGSPTTTATGLTLTDARLCRTLSTGGQWECTPLGDPATPGPMFFYTRIVAPRPTKVEHRWYFGDRLEQSVTLDIQPNSSGYRTFSRRTSNARLAGPWRVELRNQDGELLREEKFTVSR